MERKAFECEIKLAENDDGTAVGTIEGYASVFGVLDLGGDVMEKGAFKATLAEWRRRKASPPMLWQHMQTEPIGIWPTLAEDEKGLKVTGQLIMDVPQAVVTRALIKGGAIKGLSIGYVTRDREIDRTTGARRLKRVDLYEISLVTFPMLPEAQLDGVKSEFDPRQLERLLRDEGGLSISEAKAAIGVFRKHALRDAGSSEDTRRDGASMLMTLRKAAEDLRKA